MINPLKLQKKLNQKAQELEPLAIKTIEELRAKDPQVTEDTIIDALMQLPQSKEMIGLCLSLAPHPAMRALMEADLIKTQRNQLRLLIQEYDSKKTK
jgi:hypothetical protein